MRHFLEVGVAHGDPLVHQQDVALDRRRGGEGQAALHAGRIGLHRHRQERPQAREVGDLVHTLVDLARGQARDATAQADVVIAGGRGIYPQAEVEKRGDPPLNLDRAFVRLVGPRQGAQQRGLARPVVPDEAQAVPGPEPEVDVAERRDIGDAGMAAQDASHVHRARQGLLQGLGVGPVDGKSDRQVGAGDRGAGHR